MFFLYDSTILIDDSNERVIFHRFDCAMSGVFFFSVRISSPSVSHFGGGGLCLRTMATTTTMRAARDVVPTTAQPAVALDVCDTLIDNSLLNLRLMKWLILVSFCKFYSIALRS